MTARREPATIRPPFDPAIEARRVEAHSQTVLRASPRRDSQMPTTPGIALEECLAALRATEPAHIESAFRIARAPSAPVLVSSADVPYLLLSRADLAWFDLSDDASRLVLRIDGVSDVEELAGALGSSLDTVCSLLEELTEQEIVAFGERG